jgi:NTE family protein
MALLLFIARPMPRPFALLLLGLLATHGVQGQRVGLVLSGGGAAGLTHIGVMQALEENGIPIDYITGSSMGALLGAMYASGLTPWEMDSLFRTDLYITMAEGGVETRFQYRFKEDAPDASLISLRFDLDTALQTSLPTNLRSPVLMDFEQMRTFAPAAALAGQDMDKLFVPYRCVASDITNQRAVVFSSGDLVQAVRASMSYPFYFKPIRVDGNLMMDGGLYNNFPSDVMYADFMPDFIIGSNVAFNAPPPSEDDLLSQVRSMMQGRTDYSIICEEGVIIEPETATSLFDFTNAGSTIEDGYRAAMERMPEILAQVRRRVEPEELAERRGNYRAQLPKLEFGDIHISGLNRSRSRFVENSLWRGEAPIALDELKPQYFRLFADKNIALLYPRAIYVQERGDFDLDVLVRPEKDLEVRFGGMFSSRPINTGMVGLRYNLFGRSSAYIDASSYFGKFYAAGQMRLRANLSTTAPIYLEPVFTLHRWDHFRSFATFFDEVKPSFVVMRETWGGANVGLGLGNKGLLRFDVKIAETKDQYYQTDNFLGRDTADVTWFRHWTSGLLLERNSLNRKQHPNSGERFGVELRYVNGNEFTDPGSTQTITEEFRADRQWILAKASLDKYFLPKGHFRFGFLLEGVASNMPSFQNYTASVIRAPVFHPTPESRTWFIDQFRAPNYLAGGMRTIIALARNKFDLRVEGYVFQPYEPFVRGAEDITETAAAFTRRYFIGSGSVIYQSPVGPVWFNLSYFDGISSPWVWSINFGYILFDQKAQE